MHLQQLHIRNFRCFEDYTINFAPGVTVLFGKNGAGKSSLIHAIHKALSFIFDKDVKQKEEANLTSGFPKLKVKKFDKADCERDWKTGILPQFIDIAAQGSFGNEPLQWQFYASTSTFAPQPSLYWKAFAQVMRQVKELKVLPFVAYYSDSFPHISKKSSITRSQYGNRNVGYLDWDEESACSEIWLSRLQKTWDEWYRAKLEVEHEKTALKNCDVFLQQNIVTKEQYDEDVRLHQSRYNNALKDCERFDPEISAIRSCLVKFSKGDPYIEINDFFNSPYTEEGFCFETSQRNNPSVHKLPAGYKRIFFIVLDIAYRSFMLNGHVDPRGIAIIDEVDLHLHPELEQTILERLVATFPHLQFIVSTHSPLVLAGIDTKDGKNVVLRMEPDTKEPSVLRYVHGIDYNLMLEENMGVKKRKPEIDKLFVKVWDAVSESRIDDAKALVAELEEKTPSDQSELVKLRALIKRLEILGK